MPAVLSFKTLPVVLAAAVGLCPLAPPEHLHEGTDPDGHHHQVAHRHTLLHVTDSDRDQPGDHDGAAVHVEDPEYEHIVNVDAVFTMPGAIAWFVAPAADVFHVPVPAGIRRALRPSFVEHLIHGPPRASPDLRGPPSSPSL
jgi:hypothetical protein